MITYKEILFYALGILPSVTVFIWKKTKSQSDIKKFRNLMLKSYFEPIREMINNSIEMYSSAENRNQVNNELEVHNIAKEIDIEIKRLSYLLENEIVYYNSEVRFEFVRIIEYLRIEFKNYIERLKRYEFAKMSADTIGQNIKMELKNVLEVSKRMEDFEKRLVKYQKLESEY